MDNEKAKGKRIITLFSVQIAIFIFLTGLAITDLLADTSVDYKGIPMFFSEVRIGVSVINILLTLVMALIGERKGIKKILLPMTFSLILEIATIVFSILVLNKIALLS